MGLNLLKIVKRPYQAQQLNK